MNCTPNRPLVPPISPFCPQLLLQCQSLLVSCYGTFHLFSLQLFYMNSDQRSPYRGLTLGSQGSTGTLVLYVWGRNTELRVRAISFLCQSKTNSFFGQCFLSVKTHTIFYIATGNAFNMFLFLASSHHNQIFFKKCFMEALNYKECTVNTKMKEIFQLRIYFIFLEMFPFFPFLYMNLFTSFL